MKAKIINLGLSVCLLLSSVPVMAKKVVDLYQAQVSVSDRSQKSWQLGIKEGLVQVFVKVSGNNQVGTIPQVRESLENAEKFVESFGYKSKASDLLLVADFSERQVRKVLRDARQSLWGEDRPETIIWFSRQAHNFEPVMIGATNFPDISKALRQQALRRGIPVKLPKLDQSDLSQISLNEMRLLNKFAMERASKRYDSEAVLGVQISQNIEDQWDAKCRLLVNGQTIEWYDQANSEEEIFSRIIDRLASELADEVLALRYHASQERVELEIEGVSGLDDYVKVVDFVKHLLPVTDVEVLGVKADVLRLNVLSGGGVSGLSEAISHAKHRTLEVNADADFYHRNLLKYRYLSKDFNSRIKDDHNEHISAKNGDASTRLR